MKELLCLIDRIVFEIVPKSEADGDRVFGSGFFDEIKFNGTKDAYAKPRLLVQGYNDKVHGFITPSPTVQRSSQRILLSIGSLRSSGISSTVTVISNQNLDNQNLVKKSTSGL